MGHYVVRRCERDLAAVDRLAYAALRTSPAVHGLGAAVRHRVVSVRARAVDRDADPASCHPGRGGRPDDPAVAIAAFVELSERESGHGARIVGDDDARRAGCRAVARRLDHRQYFVALDFLHQRAGGSGRRCGHLADLPEAGNADRQVADRRRRPRLVGPVGRRVADRARRRARDSAPVGPCRLRRHAPEPLPRPRQRAGVQRRRRLALVRRRDSRVSRRCGSRGRPRPGIGSPGARSRRPADSHGLRGRDPLRHSRGSRRPARGGAARRAAHVDGCEGGRLGRDTAHREARRGTGALAQRVAHRGVGISPLGRTARAGHLRVRRALLESRWRLPVRRGRRRSQARYGRCDLPAKPDLRRGRIAAPAAERQRGPPGRGRRRTAAPHAARVALARAGRAGIHGAI